MDETVFTAYLDQVLDPTLRFDNTMLLNRLSVHKVGGLEQMIEKYGARLLYMPRVHPILTRLNGPSLQQAQNYLRTARTRTCNALEAIRTAAG